MDITLNDTEKVLKRALVFALALVTAFSLSTAVTIDADGQQLGVSPASAQDDDDEDDDDDAEADEDDGEAPAGGADTGFGGLAQDGDAFPIAPAALAGVIAAGAAGTLVVRRRTIRA